MPCWLAVPLLTIEGHFAPPMLRKCEVCSVLCVIMILKCHLQRS